MKYPDMHNKKVKVIKIVISDGMMNLPFDQFGTYEENLKLSESFIGTIGIAFKIEDSTDEDYPQCQLYDIDVGNGIVGCFTVEELELVK